MNDLMDIEKPKILMKNNLLIQAKYSLTLVENRIFLLILYKLQKENDGVLSCEISHDEFKQIIKHSNNKTIQCVCDSLSSLRKKSIFFMEEKDNKKGSIWGEYGFLNGFIYDDEHKMFKIESSQKIYDLINNYLQTGYTPANLVALFSMKNYYAQRLYDLLRLWSGTKTVINYSIQDLKMYLQLDNSYAEYGNFKRRVIMPAIKELNETGYFQIEMKENKVGRKVNSIDFIVKDLDKRKYFEKAEIVDIQPESSFERSDSHDMDKNIYKDSIKETDLDNLYIPDETVFTKGTLRSFKKDFINVNFKNEYMERAFDDAVMITLDRDDVETIKATSYKFFKGTLLNKITEYKLEEKSDIEYKQELELFWPK